MRDAGMARLAQEDGLEDGGSLELHRVGLVARRGRDIEFDRIEDLRLVVVRIGLRHVFHCFEIGQHAAAMIDLVEVGVERRHRVDEVALTLRLRTDCLAFLDRRQPERQVGDRRRRVRIVEQAERDAPIGDPAFRVGLQHLLEQLLRLAIPERMLVAHGAVEPPLRNLVARGVEMNRAKSLVGVFLGEDRLRA